MPLTAYSISDKVESATWTRFNPALGTVRPAPTPLSRGDSEAGECFRSDLQMP